MVTDEEDFVRANLLALSQLGLDDSGGAERVAVTFAGRIRISTRHHRAVCVGIIRATCVGRAVEDLPVRRHLQPMARPGREKFG